MIYEIDTLEIIPKRPPGRPRKFTECKNWKDELRWGYLVLSKLVKNREAARANGVHPITVTRWCKHILESYEPECIAIRRHLDLE